MVICNLLSNLNVDLFPSFSLWHSWKCNTHGASYLECDHRHPHGGPNFGWISIYRLNLRLCFDLWFLEMYGPQQCWSHPTWALWVVSVPQACSLHPHVSTNMEHVCEIWAVNLIDQARASIITLAAHLFYYICPTCLMESSFGPRHIQGGPHLFGHQNWNIFYCHMCLLKLPRFGLGDRWTPPIYNSHDFNHENSSPLLFPVYKLIPVVHFW